MAGEDASALAMIISELVQNAAEHGLADRDGHIVVTAERTGSVGEERLDVTITDDGHGLPSGFRPGASGLGTQIVQSLIQDLRGSIAWRAGEPRGTVVEFSAQLRTLAADGRS